MEVKQQIISDITRLLNKEEGFKRDVERLSSELALEEQSYKVAQMDHQMSHREIDGLQQVIDLNKQHLQTVNSIRRTLRTSLVLNRYLEKFVETMEPTKVDQLKKLEEVKANYDKMLRQYEDSPTYLAISKEEATEKELIELIRQKKLETMKLETEQEF